MITPSLLPCHRVTAQKAFDAWAMNVSAILRFTLPGSRRICLVPSSRFEYEISNFQFCFRFPARISVFSPRQSTAIHGNPRQSTAIHGKFLSAGGHRFPRRHFIFRFSPAFRPAFQSLSKPLKAQLSLAIWTGGRFSRIPFRLFRPFSAFPLSRFPLFREVTVL
jgi:hypothetical protein